MPMLFVRHTPIREAALQAAEIPFVSFRIAGRDGLLINDDYRARSLVAMQARIVDETVSSYDGITILNLRPAPNPRRSAIPATVVLDRWEVSEAGDPERFVQVATEFSESLGVREIVLFENSDRNRTESPRTDEEKFTIFFWTAPVGYGCDGMCTSPSYMWDIDTAASELPLWHDEDSSAFRNDTINIRDSRSNRIANLTGNNLYILYPIYDPGMENGPAVLRRILEEVVPYRLSENERAALLETREAERQERVRIENEERVAAARAAELARIDRIRTDGAVKRDQSREAYIKACSRRFENVIKETREAIVKCERDAAQLQIQLVALIRQSNGAKRKLQQMESAGAQSQAEYVVEFEKLFSVPHVIDVRDENGSIVVYTDIINCQDPRTSKYHEIGAFRIEIKKNGSLYLRNQTRQVGRSYDAPHISDGSPCLGNMSEVIPQLAGNYEYAALIMIAIQFIESVNLGGEYQDITNWPLAA